MAWKRSYSNRRGIPGSPAPRFRRRVRARAAGGPPPLRGRYAGYYRRSGFWRSPRDSGPELKFHDVDADLAGADYSAGTIVNTSSLNLIAQGVTEGTRVGRKCVIRSINWRGAVKLVANAAGTVTNGALLRILIVLDKQCNGAAPAVTDVLETANYASFNNLANKSRFRTLMDRTYKVDCMAAAGDGTANDTPDVYVPCSFFKKVNIPLEFSSTTGAIAEIRSNNIFMLAIGNTTTTNVSMDSKVRLRFSDL